MSPGVIISTFRPGRQAAGIYGWLLSHRLENNRNVVVKNISNPFTLGTVNNCFLLAPTAVTQNYSNVADLNTNVNILCLCAGLGIDREVFILRPQECKVNFAQMGLGRLGLGKNVDPFEPNKLFSNHVGSDEDY